MAAAARGDPTDVNPLPPLNVDTFLLGPGQPDMLGGSPMIGGNSNISPRNRKPEPPNIDFDFEKHKIKLYVAHDIMQECFNP